jgi:hypothetical protein
LGERRQRESFTPGCLGYFVAAKEPAGSDHVLDTVPHGKCKQINCSGNYSHLWLLPPVGFCHVRSTDNLVAHRVLDGCRKLWLLDWLIRSWGFISSRPEFETPPSNRGNASVFACSSRVVQRVTPLPGRDDLVPCSCKSWT